MHRTPARRGLAALLCAQPFLWIGNAAWAQPMPHGPGALGEPLAFPQGEPEPRAERAPGPTSPGAGLALPPVDEAVEADRYPCGPGDVLELNFWGVQNFRVRSTIDLEGRAFVPKVGYFDLRGKTLAEARQALRQAVAALFPRLSFDVHLAEPRTFLVQVAEAVGQPGSYPARAVERVATLVRRAGGFAPSASQRRVEVRRRDGSVATVDLLRFAQTGDVAHNPRLLDGDVVRVPFETLAASASGAVNRPGRYELVSGRGVAELVELSGGVAPQADLGAAHLLRRGQAVAVDLEALVLRREAAADRPVEPGDTLVVPEKRRGVTVEGAVARPGAYPYHPSHGVEQYLALAGGTNRLALPLSEVRLVTAEGKIVPYQADLVVQPGSALVVPERNYSRSEIAQLILGAASVVVSGVAVILAARK